VFLLTNHNQPWRWRYFGGRLEKLGEVGGKKRKLVVEGKSYTCINTYVYTCIYVPV